MKSSEAHLNCIFQQDYAFVMLGFNFSKHAHFTGASARASDAVLARVAILCVLTLLGGTNAVAQAGHATALGRPLSTLGTHSSLIGNVAVFGADDRSPLPRNLSELAHSIGLIASDAAGTMCTGFCVGKRTVATAAHCLFRTVGERRADLASFHFSVGPQHARRRAGIAGRHNASHRQNVIAGSTSLRVTPPIDVTRDWALMRLDQPICQGHSLVVDDIGPKQIDRLAARQRLLHISFHGDLGNGRLAVSQTCTTKTALTAPVRRQIARDFSDTASLVLHECDTGLASSGSPLLALTADNSLSVVAINVGTYQQTRYRVTQGSVTRRYRPATLANTAVSGTAFANHILAFARADLLDNLAIAELQRALAGAGYDAGGADGLYGERTRAAVMAFERSLGRSSIGLATQRLLGIAKQLN